MPIRSNSLDDLKIHRAIDVPPSCPLVEAAALMVREGVPAVLVLENGRSVGLVTERTVVDTVAARMPLDTPVSVLMYQPVPAIAASASPVEATALLLSADVGCLGVMDEAGYHVGVLDGRNLLLANERAARCQREADQRLRLMMEAIDDGLWDWNIVEDRFYLNPYSYKALGYEPNAFPINSATWKEFVHPDDLPPTSMLLN